MCRYGESSEIPHEKKNPSFWPGSLHSCLWIPACKSGNLQGFLPMGTDSASPLTLGWRMRPLPASHSPASSTSPTSPWICFGGSYAGSLAAWARLKVLGSLWVDWGKGTWTARSITQIIGKPPSRPSSLHPPSQSAFIRVQCVEYHTTSE